MALDPPIGVDDSPHITAPEDSALHLFSQSHFAEDLDISLCSLILGEPMLFARRQKRTAEQQAALGSVTGWVSTVTPVHQLQSQGEPEGAAIAQFVLGRPAGMLPGRKVGVTMWARLSA